jgi:BirA family transcriptional regulator, biotin operon repressor / biotin---[acetyl-CoA-carboxylase] ligase
LDTHYDIVSLAAVSSTQDVSSSLIAKTGNPTLVLAARQTAGRGRRGRSWVQPDRALFSSFVFVSTWPSAVRPVITLCAAVALAESIDDVLGIHTEIKWPNDLLLDGKKVAGILVEVSGDIVNVGCGANLWWPDPPTGAGALAGEPPAEDADLHLATGWVDRLITHLERGSRNWPRVSYLERSWTIGRAVQWDSGTGIARDLDGAGGLIVETKSGTVTIREGEVHTMEPAEDD